MRILYINKNVWCTVYHIIFVRITDIMDWWSSSSNSVGRTRKAVLLGQLASFFLALAGFNSSLLASRGVDAPITQGFFVYLAMTLVYGSILLYRRRKLQLPWRWYLLVGFLDVQANFLVNKAYQFSSITSITLLLCLSVPWVVILTWLVLGTRYSILQLVGSALCVAGLVVVLFSDAWSDPGGSRLMPLLGDTLVLGGSIFFAMANVGEEFAIRKGDWIELLAMLSIFGVLFSSIEVSVFELERLGSTKWSINSVLAMVGYVFSTCCSYSTAPHILENSGATLLNLSNLTTNMWAVAIRFFFYRQKVDGLYFLAVAIVMAGLVIYSTKTKDSIPDASDGDSNSEYHQLQDEERNIESLDTRE